VPPVRSILRFPPNTEWMANQEICIAMSWSRDYALSKCRARAVGVNVNLAFNGAEGGTNQNFSSLLIPRARRTRRAAHRFPIFMLRPT